MDRRDAEKLLRLEKRTYTSDELRTAVAAMTNAWQPDGVLATNTDPRFAAVMLERVEEAGRVLEEALGEDARRAAESRSAAQSAEEDEYLPQSVAGGFLHTIAGRVRTVSLVLIVVFAGLFATCVESAVRLASANDSGTAVVPVLLGATSGLLALHEWRSAGLARGVCQLCGRLAVRADEGRLDIPIAVLRAVAKAVGAVGGFVFRWLKRYITS